MTINNKQSKITPAFSSENAFKNNNRSIHLRLLAWIPALFVAAAIFWFSSKPAVESTEMSDSVSRLILLIGTKFGFFRGDPTQYADLIELMSFPVRKTAHMTEYLVFYGTVRFGLHFSYRTPDLRRRLFAAFVIVFCYACTDEFHQLFVPGRAGRFTDVMIDCFLVLVVTFICFARHCEQNRQEKSDSVR